MKENFIDIYISGYPFDCPDEKIYPSVKREEISSCGSNKVRRQKYYVWKLLEKALESSFGLSMKAADLKKSDNGAWQSDCCFFSLSHADKIAVAAVSDSPVGIDIEHFRRERFDASLAGKILNEKEKAFYSRLPEVSKPAALARFWCMKESIFKISNEKKFMPKRTPADLFPSAVYEFKSEEQAYFIAVSGKNISRIGVFYPFGGSYELR